LNTAISEFSVPRTVSVIDILYFMEGSIDVENAMKSCPNSEKWKEKAEDQTGTSLMGVTVETRTTFLAVNCELNHGDLKLCLDATALKRLPQLPT
jgi:hypothetical protein